MVKITLVERDIQEGKVLLSTMKKMGIKVDIAAWMYSMEDECWNLYIAVPDYYKIGPGNSYLKTREAIDASFYTKNPDGTFSEASENIKGAQKIHLLLSNTKLLSPLDDYYSKLIETVGTPDKPSEITGRFFAGEDSFTIGYVYPGNVDEEVFA